MQLQKDAIDIGIIAAEIEPMLTFYRDVLGLVFETAIPFPGGGTMHRFRAGGSVVKVIELEPQPEVQAPRGGIRGATGYRYWTIHVEALEDCVEKIGAAGYRIIVPAREIRSGISIAIVADPDGNWVELLENS
ncbi:MAG: VOC family protein [Gammaproteobacteria bacterium]|nr:VOC family protein [Gammaproteobacteria bacterium]MYK04438.1 VOC family protein [Gammaproteobacteria bacterium]